VSLALSVLVALGLAVGYMQMRKAKVALSPSPKTAAIYKPRTSPTASPTATLSPTPVPKTVLEASGTGPKRTEKFTANGAWIVEWSFECPRGPQQIYGLVYDDTGHLSADAPGFRGTGTKGGSTEKYLKGGTYSILVNTQCSWRIVVKA
jgi:hypothetical protein